MSDSKGMLDAIRAQMAALTDGQRIFVANHLFKNYNVYPTKLRQYLPEEVANPLKFKMGDVVEVVVDGSINMTNELEVGQKGIVKEVDESDERLPYKVFYVDADGEPHSAWAPEDQLLRL